LLEPCAGSPPENRQPTERHHGLRTHGDRHSNFDAALYAIVHQALVDDVLETEVHSDSDWRVTEI
jgi:hypothetical protein